MNHCIYTEPVRRELLSHFTGVRTEVWGAYIMHTACGLQSILPVSRCWDLSPVHLKKRILRVGLFSPEKIRSEAERKLHKYFLSIRRIFWEVVRSICYIIEKRAVHGPSHISIGMGPGKRCPTYQHGCARGQSLCCAAEHRGESDE